MIRLRKTLTFCLLVFLLSSCQDKNKEAWLSEIPQGVDAQLVSELAEMTNPCKDPLNYIPDMDHLDHTSLKKIKVNFHVIRDDNGEGNFSEEFGRKFIKETLFEVNKSILKNSKMKLPLGNNTPVLTGRYTLEMTPTDYIPGDDGIYFHNDDEHCFVINRGRDKNIFDRSVYEKYGIQKDSVVNVFIQDVHKDSIISKSYEPASNGVAFGNWIKAGLWYFCATDTLWENGVATTPRKYRPFVQLHHEMGHCFGLAHAWRTDGCDDTPSHDNCFSPSLGTCKVASNNVMDYNGEMSALTPCQIGKIHMTALTRPQRKNLLVKDWCKLTNFKSIIIEKDFVWNDCKTLQGNLTIKDGARLVIRCKTSLPNGGTITVHPQGELVLQGAHLYNDCNNTWGGIKVLQSGNVTGKVTYLGKQNIIENCDKKPVFVGMNKVKS